MEYSLCTESIQKIGKSIAEQMYAVPVKEFCNPKTVKQEKMFDVSSPT